MTNKNKECITPLSVVNLFKQDHYIIPIYQRNYAWGEAEIEQFLQDIWDEAKKSTDKKSAYYIGSLVADQRVPHVFETIDGQQRHTTLSIILSVLKNEFSVTLDDIDHLNLGFDSRPKSSHTLDNLFNNKSDEAEESTIRSAYNIAKRFIASTIKPENINTFSVYLLNEVQILRVVVPKETDLNHYFEIMNNRGEQLEKHEVLKARLMNELANDADGSKKFAFATIWDACADMTRYVQLGVSTAYRDHVFSSDWNQLPTKFEVLCENMQKTSEKKEEKHTLASIIKGCKFHSDLNKTEKNEGKVSAFGSVINFSNFLLHVLKIATSSEEVSLDDKQLLKAFDGAINRKNITAEEFIVDLLKIRMLFDRYIIKRENEESWSLSTLKPYRNQKPLTFSYVNSFEDSVKGEQLKMLLSMFHVSYPTLVYKRWLNAALKALTDQYNHNQSIDVDLYINQLESLSDEYFFEDYKDNKEALNEGTAVKNFVFNRLDYLLWKALRDDQSFGEGSGVDIKYVRKRAEHFQFAYRTSVDHYFPQTNPWGEEEMDLVDRFGNLCLITPSTNSKLSNYSPADKKTYFENKKESESVKQIFMMSYQEWGKTSAGMGNIEHHETEMLNVLYKRLSS